MTERALTPVSYIVLGLLNWAPATPYELKTRVAASLGNFWSVRHAQLYTETARLAKEGLLSESRESEGRRRKTYAITKAGKKALQDWLAVPPAELLEVRDLALLKVFFGSDPEMIASVQLEFIRGKLAEFERLHKELRKVGTSRGVLLALEAGIGYGHESVRFWSSLA